MSDGEVMRMSVLIKGIDMPKSCGDCPCRENGYCCFTNVTIPYDGTRHANCPLEKRPKGKWIKEPNTGIYQYKCDQCLAHHRARYDFCPSCGADMRGDADG